MGFRWEAFKQKIPTLFADLLQSIKAIFLKLQSEMRSKLNRLILVTDSIY